MNDALLRLEFSRLREWLPGRRLSAWWKLPAVFALLFFFGLGMDQYLQLQTFGQAGLLGTLFASGVWFALTYFTGSAMRHDPAYAWWIRLPYPRFELVRARFLAMCALGYIWYPVVWIAVIAAHAVLAPDGANGAGSAAAATAVIGLAAIPIGAAFGLMSTVFIRRGWSWLLLGYAQMALAIGGVSGLLGVVLAEETMVSRMAAGPLWTAALVLIAGGWPLAYGMLRLAAKYGLANLADNRNIMTTERRAAAWKRVRPGASQGAASSRAIRSLQHALFRLEWQRITLYAASLPGRIAACILMAGLVLGGWFAYGNSMIILILALAPAAFAAYLMLLSVSVMFSTDIQQRKLDWQLMLPVPRLRIVLGKLSAHWAAGLAVAAASYGSVWLGLTIRCLVEDHPLATLRHDAAWGVYSFLIGGLIYMAVIAFIIGSLAASVSIPPLSVMIALLYLIPAFGSRRLIAFYFPPEEQIGLTAPYWTVLGITAAGAVVLTIVYIAIAVRTIDSLVKAKTPKSGWGFGGNASA